jgi:hypothetical protein
MIAFAMALMSVVSLFVAMDLFTSRNNNWTLAAFVSLWFLGLALLSVVVEIQNKLEEQ